MRNEKYHNPNNIINDNFIFKTIIAYLCPFVLSASVDRHEKLLKISVCKFTELYRNINQVNLSLIKSYLNNWTMDNSRTGCFYLLDCA